MVLQQVAACTASGSGLLALQVLQSAAGKADQPATRVDVYKVCDVAKGCCKLSGVRSVM